MTKLRKKILNRGKSKLAGNDFYFFMLKKDCRNSKQLTPHSYETINTVNYIWYQIENIHIISSQDKGKTLVSCQKMQISSPIHVGIWLTILLFPRLTRPIMIYHWWFTKISTPTNQDLTTEERKKIRAPFGTHNERLIRCVPRSRPSALKTQLSTNSSL